MRRDPEPGDEVGEELRLERVVEGRAHRQAECGHVHLLGRWLGHGGLVGGRHGASAGAARAEEASRLSGEAGAP